MRGLLTDGPSSRAAHMIYFRRYLPAPYRPELKLRPVAVSNHRIYLAGLPDRGILHTCRKL